MSKLMCLAKDMHKFPEHSFVLFKMVKVEVELYVINGQ
jgi:hypothetical protein